MGNEFFLPSDPVTLKVTEKGSSMEQKIRYACSGMKGHRSTMEDEHVHSNCLPVGGKLGFPLTDHSIFCVFDGHGGGFTSTYLKDNFLKVLAERDELIQYAQLNESGQKGRSDVNGIQLLREAVARTFMELDMTLLPLQQERHKAIVEGKLTPSLCDIEDDDDEENESPTITNDSIQGKKPSVFLGERSGATGVVVVLTPSHILCANAGDSRAILRRNGQALPLSFDHKPSNVPERVRIQEANGTVKGKRVDGDLAVSRAFGDFSFKGVSQMPAHRQKVICVPDLIVYPRKLEHDEFVILACDGVWDVATNTECSDFVQTLLSEGETDLGDIAEEALDTCLERYSRDNMTICIVGLPGLKSEATKSAKMTNAIWGQRTARKARQLQLKVSMATTNVMLKVADEIGIERSVCV